MKTLVERLSREYNVPLEISSYIVEHESGYTYDEIGDEYLTCQYQMSPFFGKKIRARGLLQITDCYHWEVTDEQALDPEWSLRWALPKIINKEVCMKEWTTCRAYYTK